MSDDPEQPTTEEPTEPTEQTADTDPEADAAAAGHDRTNPSGIPDEGLEHTHLGETHVLKREAQEVPAEHHEDA